MAKIDKLNIVLVEQRRTSKWLAETLEKNEVAVFRWYTNELQPLLEIDNALKVGVKKRLVLITK